MEYILVVFYLSLPPSQIGPFGNIFACEKAAEQVRMASSKIVSMRARTACINLKAKPHHWNGKSVK